MTQKQALSLLKTGASVFLTGKPGSGKTHTVRRYVDWLRAHNIEPAITASTGIAATHIGGYTIHSWSGVGIKDSLSQKDKTRLSKNSQRVKRAQSAKVLIVDEVSMLSAAVFSAIDEACKILRQNTEPFGGLQVVLVGDFFQLPPVVSYGKKDENTLLADNYDDPREQFAFRSSAWQELAPQVCYLHEQYRQEDEDFLALLTAIRNGSIDEQHRQQLRTCYAPTAQTADNKHLTQLYSHNIDVDRVNAAKIKELPGTARTFKMKREGPKKLTNQLVRGCLSPETLALKEGAQVMFTKNNFREKFVNGTIGTISGFDETHGYPIVKTRSGRSIIAYPMEWHIESEGKVLARIEQLPLRLAWAITVHKSQGMSLDAAHMDLSRTFEYGQGYVALSRVRSLEGLSLAGLNQKALQVHPEIQEKDSAFRAASRKVKKQLGSLSQKERAKKHKEFILACGGRVKPKKDATPSTKQLQEKSKSTYEKTKDLLCAGHDVDTVAQKRDIQPRTVWGHVEQLIEEAKITASDITHLIPTTAQWQEAYSELQEAIEACGTEKLKPLYEYADEKYNYDTVRLARIVYMLENS